ncbi:hypothetical protein [Bartonella sp. CL63NXGY]|uniref:hypothetical protein n=1 Tax=Bartonella sp. CL63NXGY TaxID=3243538 RepID=UPI0035CFB044
MTRTCRQVTFLSIVFETSHAVTKAPQGHLTPLREANCLISQLSTPYNRISRMIFFSIHHPQA